MGMSSGLGSPLLSAIPQPWAEEHSAGVRSPPLLPELTAGAWKLPLVFHAGFNTSTFPPARDASRCMYAVSAAAPVGRDQ